MTNTTQQSLFPADDYLAEFTPDDWETPDWLAQEIAAHLVRPAFGVNTQSCIVEVGAGNGAISRYLPKGTHCIEQRQSRYQVGRSNAPLCQWHYSDFLQWECDRPVDAIVGNPPFSVVTGIINHGFSLLKPGGFLLLLMPGDTLHKPTIIEEIKQPFLFDIRPVVSRVAYIKNGRTVVGRQIYDSLFSLCPVDEPHPQQWIFKK